MRVRELVPSILVLLALACAGDDPRAARLPNVLVISIDTLNRSALRAYDDAAPALPNLERFAERAVVFEQAFSSASWTLPAHASLLTGLYTDRHGAAHQDLGIAPEVETLAASLQRAGYQTVGFGEGAFVDRGYGFDRGFERYDGEAHGEAQLRMELPRAGAFAAVPGTALFDRALAFLRQRDESRPFFLFVQTYTVHDYFKARPWATARFPEREFGDIEHNIEVLYGARPSDAQDWTDLRDLYRAEVERLDRGFGLLLAVLDDLGLGDSTLIVLVSDHGEGFRPDLGRTHHGGRLHADLLHVPLLVAGPGIAPARRADPVSLVDVDPTVLDFVGLAPPTDLDGRSFLPALLGTGSLAPRELLAHSYNFLWIDGRRAHVEEPPTNPLSVAVITPERWYIKNARAAEELYSRGSDPGQLDNLAGDAQDLSELRRVAARRSALRPARAAVEADAARERRLRELGYTDR